MEIFSENRKDLLLTLKTSDAEKISNTESWIGLKTKAELSNNKIFEDHFEASISLTNAELNEFEAFLKWLNVEFSITNGFSPL